MKKSSIMNSRAGRTRISLLMILSATLLVTSPMWAFGDGETYVVETEQTPPNRKHLPSPVIFPDQYLPLNFNHKLHVEEAGFDCVDCHDTAASSEHSRTNLLPPEETCLGCHIVGEPPEEGVPGGTCETCHIAYKAVFPEGADESETNQVSNPPPHVVIPPPNIKMNHKVHVDAGIDCATCHKQTAEVEIATRDNSLPVMGTCLTCHDGTKASLECVTCHETTSVGRMKVDFGAQGMLRPSGRYFGDTHDAAFLKDHAALARARGDYCTNCHSQSFCNDCHSGALRPGRVHPSNWILIHPTRARGNDMACSSCHRSQTFCTSCHERVGVTLANANFPKDRLRFHPAGWLNTPGAPRGPNHHGFQAQRNIRTCASCHVENDCISCHATGTLNVNPHPIGFKSTCKNRMRANPQTCYKCHTPTDPNLFPCR